MKITDPKMAKKMERALSLGLNLYDLDSIEHALNMGDLQAHTVGDTLAITRVGVWPKRKSVDILYVVGNIDEALHLEQEIIDWAKILKADLITAVGRNGWWEHHTPGWKRVGTLYAKEI